MVESAQQSKVEELRMHWQFVRGMASFSALPQSRLTVQSQLTNLGALPVDRIHSMLSKFVPDFGGRTVGELEDFLEMMKREGMVERAANRAWKLV
jgi:anaphase-promoting complex subunit 2